ncbi:LPXTG cell wall anchor domain-containing protein [Streptococcus mitis]|uniref:LPXTG cell wall anchor domain-containing protein n=1 Tax=Streptococcus mitis TaxID=28037 RepID=UPI0009E3553C|nr:LPXTG cell wall anchor domain-containing protein [Streptococcus mitis]
MEPQRLPIQALRSVTPIAGKDLVIEDFTPVKPDEKVVVQDKSHLTPEEKKQVEDKVKAKNPGKTVTVGDDGTATVTDPSTKISHPIAGKDLVNEDFGVNGIPEVTPSQPEYTDPVGTSSTDGNGNLIDPPVVDIPEFNGGVNGELPDPVELPKVKLIITKWIDEQGNELKPADAKAPAVLGEANEAFEHGEIEGYVFVRTDVNEEGDVVTHVFRKVTPTKPEGNGEQQGGDNTPQPTPEVPTDNTERKPETEKPTVPDTKQTEQPTQIVDAQVAPSQNQAVLPNTGTKADRATGALGALSLLGAFGLLFAKKKKDDEEETQNN